jgi:predicted MPP superfamily phosphohydrolase
LTKRRRRIEWSVRLIILALLAYALVEPFLLRVREVTIADPDLPADFDDLRIAFLADFHCAWFFPPSRVSGVVRRANDLQADLVVLGGDYVNTGTEYVAPCFAELAELRAPLGVYAVLGNHDHWGAAQAVRDAVRDSGFTLVENAGVWLERGDARVRVGGVADMWEGVPRLGPAIHGVSEADFVLLVSHNPDFAEELRTDLVDVTLAAHTHGGQVTLFGLWAPLVNSKYGQKYRSGVVAAPRTMVVMTNGAGGAPLRFCARPEIVLVTLRREEPLP